MPRKSKDLIAQVNRIASAWRSLHPDKTFSGLTLAKFLELAEPSRAVRAELAELSKQTQLCFHRRRAHDFVLRPVLARVVHSVRGDPDVGEDSLMYTSMGYVRKSRRLPGRKRKAARPADKTRAAAKPK